METIDDFCRALVTIVTIIHVLVAVSILSVVIELSAEYGAVWYWSLSWSYFIIITASLFEYVIAAVLRYSLSIYRRKSKVANQSAIG